MTLSSQEMESPEIQGRFTLMRHVERWTASRNQAKVKADWQFTTAEARIKLRKLYPIFDG